MHPYKSPKKIAERLIKYYNTGSSTGWRPNKLEYLFQCFDSICVLNEMFIFSSYVYHKSYDEKVLIPHINTVKDKYHFNTSGANFLQRLFSYLDVENNPRKINNKYFNEIVNESEIEQLGIIHDEGWLNSHQIIGRNIMTSEQDFKDRFNNVVNWMNGEMTTDELVEEYSKKKTVPNRVGRGG